MNILMFIVSFGLLVASFFGMALAFNTPGYELVIFFGALLVMTASFALPGRWLRNL
jgi:4-amino-4-deoxy-L-arabinose transferase-like glycosyltransferase